MAMPFNSGQTQQSQTIYRMHHLGHAEQPGRVERKE
jgi:hypothetical protein